ncbi:parallel beta-helix domain-containing protein [Haliscomenobacter sp.]|uniref:parallel beta-helix domain-containing protein n=1 Tax=Haliscomenobacter sp. TaxID=2717303 RepID=UPI0033651A81
MKFFQIALLIAICAACSNQPAEIHAPDTALYTDIQTQLINAKPGDVIKIPAGTHYFDRPLLLDGVKGVTIQGAGKDKTILSFLGQKAGAEGLRITADSVLVQDLTVIDSKGDAIRIQDAKNITLRNVKTTWSGGAKAANGGYGLYPVGCDGVLIDKCEASFASDAGIYVGQSRNVLVINSYAHENVAGIEIENCTNAEVRYCRSEQNTGGILVFDLPGLPAGNGKSCKIHHNKILRNNHRNFAPEGNIVATVAPGTGLIFLAAKDVEVYKNEVIGHKTMGAAIASYHMTQLKWDDKNYDPYTYDIKLHDNHFERKATIPDLTKDFGKMVNVYFRGRPQDILYDGILDDKKPKGANPMNICIDQPQNGLRFANLDAANDFKNIQTNLKPYQCK